VRAIGQTLAMELANEDVSCTLVQPGFVSSEIGQVDNEGNFHDEWEDKRPQQLMWSAEKAAKTIVKAIEKRKREFTFTGHGKVAAFFGKHAPGVVHHAITKFGG
jgi:short-subunit dehydrogenase